ncbi:MAG: hypothetical protein V1884_04025 [Candidatus Omnitrophota bacterium]
MEFDEIRKEVKNSIFDTLRTDEDNYFEAVVVRDELTKLKERLEKFLGRSIYPSSDKLPPHIEKQIKEFGGIKAGQTLYFHGEGEKDVFVMLWPWQDGYHVTIKIIQKQDKEPPKHV